MPLQITHWNRGGVWIYVRGLEKTYNDNDARYISFYVCRGLDTIILEVRILKGYLGRLLAIITTHNNALSAYYPLAF